MGNEYDSNSNHKILTNKTNFEQSNLRDIQDSDSENYKNKEETNSSITDSLESDEELEDNDINDNNNELEYTFIWEEKCNIAKVIGSFNNWKTQILMIKDPIDNLFKCKLKLKKEKYEYKFIIDDCWKYSTHQPTKNDGKGNINNFIDLTNYNNNIDIKKKKINKIKRKKKKIKKEKIKIDNFDINIPNKEELNTEAPIAQELFLKSFYINEATNQNKIGEKQYLKYTNRESFTEEKSYRNLIFSPHVNLNHTMSFCDNKNILQVGSSYRFRNKECTIVYYSRLDK